MLSQVTLPLPPPPPQIKLVPKVLIRNNGTQIPVPGYRRASTCLHVLSNWTQRRLLQTSISALIISSADAAPLQNLMKPLGPYRRFHWRNKSQFELILLPFPPDAPIATTCPFENSLLEIIVWCTSVSNVTKKQSLHKASPCYGV